MRTVTVQELIDVIRESADIERTQFVTDATLIKWINRSYTKLYDLVVGSYQNYLAVLTAPIPLVSGQSDYNPPSDFYKLMGVEWSSSGGAGNDWLTLRPLNFNERNSLTRTYKFYSAYRYQLVNNKVRVLPAESLSGAVRLWYVPCAPVINNKDQVIEGYNGWEEFVINDCCVKVKNKQELDPSSFILERDKSEKRIIDMAANYDAGMPSSITDMTQVNNERLFPFGW